MSKLAILSVAAALAAVAFFAFAPSADTQLEGQFNQFLVEYGRSYNSQSEYEFRMNVYSQNLDRIAQMNAEAEYPQFTVTKFADWTQEEFQQLLGDRSELEGSFCTNNAYTGEGDTSVYIDWTSKFAPIQNQGSCGSCWSFAATATIEAYRNIKGHGLTKASEQYLVDCDNEYDAGCSGGLANNAYYFLSQNNHQIATGESYPYTATDGNTCKTSGIQYIGGTGGCKDIKQTEGAMLDHLQNVGPISVSVDASNWSFYDKNTVLTQCGQSTNHAVVVVGYGTDSELQEQYWLIRNSWGTGWGKDGYIRVRYGQNTCNITRRPGYPVIE